MSTGCGAGLRDVPSGLCGPGGATSCVELHPAPNLQTHQRGRRSSSTSCQVAAGPSPPPAAVAAQQSTAQGGAAPGKEPELCRVHGGGLSLRIACRELSPARLQTDRQTLVLSECRFW